MTVILYLKFGKKGPKIFCGATTSPLGVKLVKRGIGPFLAYYYVIIDMIMIRLYKKFKPISDKFSAAGHLVRYSNIQHILTL